MGWTSVPEYMLSGRSTSDLKKFFESEWSKGGKFQLEDFSKKGNTLYLAVRRLDTGEVFAVVNLISFQKGEFFWKEIDETCGPLQQECPKRILERLTPTDDETALRWRQACLDYHRNKKELNRMYSHGDVLEFPETMEFMDGYSGKTFILFKKGRRWLFSPYRGEKNLNGVYPKYQITNWRQYRPTVIGKLA
jgi:hypothetical protein